MVKHLAELPAIESKVSVREVAETHDSEEQQQIWVVKLTLRFEGVISELIAVGLIVDIGLVIPVVATRVAAEDVDMANQSS